MTEILYLQKKKVYEIYLARGSRTSLGTVSLTDRAAAGTRTLTKRQYKTKIRSKLKVHNSVKTYHENTGIRGTLVRSPVLRLSINLKEWEVLLISPLFKRKGYNWQKFCNSTKERFTRFTLHAAGVEVSGLILSQLPDRTQSTLISYYFLKIQLLIQ